MQFAAGQFVKEVGQSPCVEYHLGICVFGGLSALKLPLIDGGLAVGMHQGPLGCICVRIWVCQDLVRVCACQYMCA